MELFTKCLQNVPEIVLSGDRSDNITGVNGIKDMHAKQLINKFGTLERLLEFVDQIEEFMFQFGGDIRRVFS